MLHTHLVVKKVFELAAKRSYNSGMRQIVTYMEMFGNRFHVAPPFISVARIFDWGGPNHMH